jgi:hypothetical protein
MQTGTGLRAAVTIQSAAPVYAREVEPVSQPANVAVLRDWDSMSEAERVAWAASLAQAVEPTATAR